jgi:hypothetical protein
LNFYDIIFRSHSLGSHLSAYINRAIAAAPGNTQQVKAKIIVGLDPAGPMFFSGTNTLNKPLSSGDAEVVYVIHTDIVAAGAPISIGTVDFYPNNGFQPGCPPIDNLNLMSVKSECCTMLMVTFKNYFF